MKHYASIGSLAGMLVVMLWVPGAQAVPGAKNVSYTLIEGPDVRQSIYLQVTNVTGTRSYKVLTLPAGGILEVRETTQVDGKYQTVYRPIEANEALTGSSLYYRPDGFTGRVSFNWAVTDDTGTSNTARVTITVEENVAPTATDQNVIVVSDQAKTIALLASDGNSSQINRLTPEVLRDPQHGKIAVSGSRLTYTPDPGFVGRDSFKWKVSDGTHTSDEATASLLVRKVGDRAKAMVVIVVEARILPELNSEVARLKQDLIDDGYSAKIKEWTGGKATDLFNYLRGEYTTPDQFMAGAIFVGRMPTARAGNGYSGTTQTTDFYYWCLAKAGVTARDRANIWVSRFNGKSGEDEIKSLRWSLQANHDYRKGLHRLPHHAYHWSVKQFDSERRQTTEQAAALEVWPEASFMENQFAWAKGGDAIKSLMHGSQLRGQMNKVAGHPIQIRFNCPSSCSQGGLGGTSNQMVFSRGGGGVFSVGASTTTYVGAFDFLRTSRSNFRARLKAGDPWGMASVDIYPFDDHYRAMFYGDLSLGVKESPDNQVPVVDSISADTSAGQAPLTVKLAGQVSDADGSIKAYEWYCEGFSWGKGVMQSTKQASHSCSYALAHRYQPELQVMDNYKARGWNTTTIVVKPDPKLPLRVQIGTASSSQYAALAGADYVDGSGFVWLHEQGYKTDDGTWGVYLRGSNRIYQAKGVTDVADTDDDLLFRTYREVDAKSTLSYRFPLGDGQFTVWLGFMEPDAKVVAGKRLVDVQLEGESWLSAFDVRAKAGAAHRAIWISKVVTVTDGELTVDVAANANSELRAAISAMVVYPGVKQGPELPDAGARLPDKGVEMDPDMGQPNVEPDMGVPPVEPDLGVPPVDPDSGQPARQDAGSSSSTPDAGPPPVEPDTGAAEEADAGGCGECTMTYLPDYGGNVPDGVDPYNPSPVPAPAVDMGAPANPQTPTVPGNVPVGGGQLIGGCTLAGTPALPQWHWMILLGLFLLRSRRRRR